MMILQKSTGMFSSLKYPNQKEKDLLFIMFLICLEQFGPCTRWNLIEISFYDLQLYIYIYNSIDLDLVFSCCQGTLSLYNCSQWYHSYCHFLSTNIQLKVIHVLSLRCQFGTEQFIQITYCGKWLCCVLQTCMCYLTAFYSKNAFAAIVEIIFIPFLYKRYSFLIFSYPPKPVPTHMKYFLKEHFLNF